MYSFLSTVYPKKIRNAFYLELEYFDVEVRKEYFLGTLLFFSIGVSLAVAFQFSYMVLNNSDPLLSLALAFIGSFILINALVFALLSVTASNRSRFIESILPDALELISANLRAGMTIDRALIAANRKEFGYLNYLLILVGKEISTGKEVADSLMEITKKVKSEKFKRTIELIVMAMKAGGELSRLLGQVSENLVHQKNIEEKIKAGVTTYLIFIGAAVCFAAPFLYGLSSVFVKIMVSSFGGIDLPPMTGGMSMPFGNMHMTPEMVQKLPPFIRMYAALSLFTLASMSSFMLGTIQRGKAKFGITFMPFLVGCSMVTYLVISWAGQLLFSSMT